MTTKADVLCTTALSQVGVTEDPPGSNMQPYGAEYGMNGVAWCCIFVWWCAQRAELPFPTTAYVPALEQWARDNGYVVPADQIRRGDVVCLDFTAPFGDGSDHVEIALGPADGGWIPCVGGNTSDKSGGSVDNGGGVYANDRPVGWVATAIRRPGSDDIIDDDQEENDMMRSLRTPEGTILLADRLHCRVMPGSWPDVEQALRQMIAAGELLGNPDGSPKLIDANRSNVGSRVML